MATNCYDITYLIWEARATGKRFYRWNNVRYDEKGDALNGRMMDNDINQLIDALLKADQPRPGLFRRRDALAC